jgi:hypothetical protein
MSASLACTKCGAALEPADRFCMECGQPVTAPAPAPPPVTAAAPPAVPLTAVPELRQRKMFTRALGLLLVAFVLGGIAYVFLRKAPQSGSTDSARAKATPAVGVVSEVPITGANSGSTLPPPPMLGPTPADEVTVPDLSRSSTKEMSELLRRAGLVRSLVAARDKPPSKEKEFTYAAQTPSAGTKVKRGSTVTVAIYAKFDGAR